ncbi:MAG TPA: hypothetical protein VF947_07695 [Myxococcales bacterium]
MVFWFSLSTILWLSVRGAEPNPASTASKAAASAASKKKKVIRLEAITVEGRIQKPQAFYILQRSNLSFDDLNQSESFVSKIAHTVEKDPF